MGNYIVFDLEWNQAQTKEKEVEGIMFEILEIGAVKLDKNKNIIDSFSSYIKPQIYHTLHYMTKKIVHFDMKELQKEEPFPVIMKRFLEWCGEDPVFCTWGPSDLTELQGNMAYYNMKPLSRGPLPFLDIQKLFSLKFGTGKERLSLENAASQLGLERDGEFHQALSDADYTAKIFMQIRDKEIEKYCSFDNYHLPKSKEEEIHINFPTYSKYISRPFKNKHSAMSDKEVSSIYCNICGKSAKRDIKWFSPNGGRYYLCLAHCQDHGCLKAKARIKKCSKDMVYVVKTIKTVPEALTKDIREKYKSVQEKLLSQKWKSSNSDL